MTRNSRLKLYGALGAASGWSAHLVGWPPALVVALAVAVPALAGAAPRFVLGVISGAAASRVPEGEMSGTEFEDHIAHIVRACGVPVIMTPRTGDWGVDLIVGRRPNRVAVQCKRQSRPVGTSAVQEVVAGAPMQDCARTMVVTNNEFTPAAHKLAERHGCELVGRQEMARLRSTIRRLTEGADVSARPREPHPPLRRVPPGTPSTPDGTAPNPPRSPA
ncbi:restriction endonuclease [Mycolicibacterium doricum]|uniref:Restriction endonuclease n=1 Tax=Mycolicibacterium doricum TaxID=126673 RepID=A0A7I7VRD3_9MYCO|nr:restriction endonuclease [Mycolicibacterium doricum]MCV7267586.1 restriction endonuclease [Mycolicibacterium doricum]BBZ06693.1 restriction endonuclease [Mycolicibacterium doricum]